MYQAIWSANTVALDLTPLSAPPDPEAGGTQLAIIQCRRDCVLRLKGRPLSLKTGDVVLIHNPMPAQLEAYSASRPVQARFFILPVANTVGIGPNAMITSFLQSTDTAHIVFRRIAHELTNGYCEQLARLMLMKPQDGYLRYEASMVANLLLTELSRARLNAMMIIESDFPEDNLRGADKAHQVGLILNYIMAHIDTVTLKSAAEYFGYEPNYFSRLCHDLFKKPFSAELRFIRMNQAKKMLAMTAQSVAEIGFSLGYKNPANFDHTFKKQFNITPSAYRRQAQLAQATDTEVR